MSTEQQGYQKRPKSDWALFILGFIVASAFGFWLTPTILYAEKIQPMDFSHKVHQEQAGDCEVCHTFREDGSFTGIPAVWVSPQDMEAGVLACTDCHGSEPMEGEIKPQEEAKLATEYISKKKPIDWFVYSRQPDCVFFSHITHLKSEKVEFGCESCHADHGQTDSLKPYVYNRLTGYSREIWGPNLMGLASPPERMKMDDCAACHRKQGVRDACFVCHK